MNAERPAPEPAPGYERLWLDHFDQAGIQTSSRFLTADEPFPVMFEAFAGVETPTDNATTVEQRQLLLTSCSCFSLTFITSP